MEGMSAIHKSLLNDQRRLMAEQITEYGLYDFWADYRDYLSGLYVEPAAVMEYFSDAVISYHRIINR